MKRAHRMMMWGVIIIIAVIGFIWFWHHSLVYPSTEDAYVNANVVSAAPQITGSVVAIYVKNYQEVKKGQKLFEIDPRPFQISLDQAEAQLALARQTVAANIAAVSTDQALYRQREADLMLATQNETRIMRLVKDGQSSKQSGDEVVSAAKAAKAALAAAQYQLHQAIAELGDLGEENAGIRQAQAQVASARLNLSYTTVTAPTDGMLVNFTTRVGDVVQASIVLFQIVDDQHWWVDSNYKETQLRRIRSGQTATVVLDMYPDHVFHGIVYRISPGSGAAFSVLPPENATGNWVKVTQRFPVRVEITDPQPDYPLRVGASAEVTVDTVSQ